MSSLQTTYHNTLAANGVKSTYLESLEVFKKMKVFESNPQVKPMRKAISQHMHIVGAMCMYIRDVRTGN